MLDNPVSSYHSHRFGLCAPSELYSTEKSVPITILSHMQQKQVCFTGGISALKNCSNKISFYDVLWEKGQEKKC